jgi:bacillithiol biosynthesis cysteine-adding enzyme BshC
VGGVITVRDLPGPWFDRPQYRPRVRNGGKDAWFIAALHPEREVPAAPPAEPAGGRLALREAVEAAYREWRLPRVPRAEASLDDLAAPGAAAVVAGQQPGFLCGPLYALYKALGAIAAARRYAARTGRRAVPIFWLVSEDHDLDEARDAFLPGGAEGEGVFRYPHAADRRPLAEYPIDEPALAVIAAAGARLASRRHGAEAQALLDLHRGRNFASAFAAFLAEVLGPEGLLVVDPVRLRPFAAPLFRRVIADPDGVLAAIRRGREEVTALGFEPLVAARLPLFLIADGRRHHLSPAPGGLQVDGGGPFLPRDEALALLERAPESFSSGALLRPLVQETVLPSVLTIGGPAEVGYFAQLGPLADFLGVRRPAIALRPQATLIDGKAARTAAALDLEIIAAARVPADLLPREEEPPALRAARELAARAGETLARAIDETAPGGKEARLRAQAQDIGAGIARLADRLAEVRASRRTAELEAATRLWDFAFPAGALQERRWGPLHFIARHGRGWIAELLAAIERDPLSAAHRWVLFGEAE